MNVLLKHALPAYEMTALGLLARKPSRELWGSLAAICEDYRLKRMAGFLIRYFENPHSLSLRQRKEVEKFRKNVGAV